MSAGRKAESRAKAIVESLEALGVKVPAYDENEAAETERAQYAELRARIAGREDFDARIGRWSFFFRHGSGVSVEDYFGSLPFAAILKSMKRLLGIDDWTAIEDRANGRVILTEPRRG